MIRELDGSRTLDQALTAALDGGATPATGLSVARRMLEIGFLEFAD